MIISNGWIEYDKAVEIGEVIDSQSGLPKAQSVLYGERIACQIIPISINNLAKSNGENIIKASYKVLSERVGGYRGRVRLSTKGGTPLGEFSIIECRELSAVNQFETYL